MPLGSEKMASQVSVPEKDLSCPVCSETLKEPVLLSCGHSCCIACLESYWKQMESWECPVCSIKCYKDSMALALKNLCMPGEKVSVKHVCSLHSKLLTLFCLEHEEPICSVCEGSSKHKTHKCIPVDEAALDRKVWYKISTNIYSTFTITGSLSPSKRLVQKSSLSYAAILSYLYSLDVLFEKQNFSKALFCSDWSECDVLINPSNFACNH